MARTLKQSFPCIRCGAPCRARSRAAGKVVRCPGCADYRRRELMLTHLDASCSLLLARLRSFNAEREPHRFVELWAGAMAKYLEGCAEAMHMLPSAASRQARVDLYRHARARMDWTRKRMVKLDGWMDYLRETLAWPGLEIIPGGGQPLLPELQASPDQQPRPVLELLKGEDE